MSPNQLLPTLLIADSCSGQENLSSCHRHLLRRAGHQLRELAPGPAAERNVGLVSHETGPLLMHSCFYSPSDNTQRNGFPFWVLRKVILVAGNIKGLADAALSTTGAGREP